MKTSDVSSTGTIILINSTNQNGEEEAAPETAKTKKVIYRIGDEIVSESVFNRYDVNKDGIISDTEKAAYQNSKAQNAEKQDNSGNTSSGNSINIQA